MGAANPRGRVRPGFARARVVRCRQIVGEGVIGSGHPVVMVEGFQGPFDLLLRLVERRELDILEISLAAVADQYLAHLSAVQQRDPEHLSAFLTVAAKLLWIKSSLLLPTPAKVAAEEAAPDPGDLTRRLRVYAQFRDAATLLAARDAANLRSYARAPMAYQAPPRPVAPLDPGLLRAAFDAARRRPKPSAPETLAAEPRISVADVVAALRAALRDGPKLSFSDLVAPAPNPQRYVAAFLAILEVVRLGLAEATQSERYGDIVVARRPESRETPSDSTV